MKEHVRVWRVPELPPRGLQAADGAAVLSEDLAGLGVILWDRARDVVLWGGMHWRDTGEIFAPAAERMQMVHLLTSGMEPLVQRSLERIARMAGDPENADRPLVALSCGMISEWADARGGLGTAFAFALAAAASLPGKAALAYEVGRLARRRADYACAETWLHRAIFLARQNRDWESYCSAHGGLVNVFIQRGNYPMARKRGFRLLRAARKHGLRHFEGVALHSLCEVSLAAGSLEEINTYGRLAYEAYGPRYKRLPMLAQDIAYGWLLHGHFAHALAVFEAALPHYPMTQDRAVILGNVCRAAAGVGDLTQFERAWATAWVLIEEAKTEEAVAECLLEMARGASTLRQWERAIAVAQRALILATERREARIQITAEAVLESIARERTSEAQRVEVPDVRGEKSTDEQNRLATDLIAGLSRYAGATALSAPAYQRLIAATTGTRVVRRPIRGCNGALRARDTCIGGRDRVRAAGGGESDNEGGEHCAGELHGTFSC